MKYIAVLAALMLCACQGKAQTAVLDMSADTTRINQLLAEGLQADAASPGDVVAYLGLKFIGTPYKGGTLEGEPETLRVRLDSVDCTTFVEMMMAMALTVDERRASWRDFQYNLQRLRYRGGEIKGYPSRLHYIADWAIDNVHRGNFSDVTTTFPKYTYVVKSLDFMTSNAEKYAALADSANLEGIRNVEIGYRMHRYPYIKTVDLGSKDTSSEFNNGDILAFTSKIKNLDVTHMGIVVLKDGVPHVLHASSSAGKVVLSERSLNEFVKKNTGFTGVRVFRLNKQ